MAPQSRTNTNKWKLQRKNFSSMEVEAFYLQRARLDRELIGEPDDLELNPISSIYQL